MKKTTIYGATLLSFGVAAALTTGVYAINTDNVDSISELNDCLSNASYDVCKLSGDITITDETTFPVVTRTVTLDLNNHFIKAKNVNANSGMIFVNHGGNLTIDDTSEAKGGKITTGDTTTYAAVQMTKIGDTDNSQQAILTIENGTLYGHYYAVVGSGNAGRDNTVININGGELNAKAADGTGIYHPQVGTLNIKDGTITGGTGIELRSGTLNVTGGTIIGTASPISVNPNGSGTTSTGAGIAVAQHTTKKDLVLNISGGTIKGYSPVYISNPQGNADMANQFTGNISGGTFNVTNGGTVPIVSTVSEIKDFVSGGTFNVEPGELKSNHYIYYNGSVYEVIDLSSLVGAIETAESKVEANYSVSSWNEMKTKLSSAKDIVTSVGGKTISQATANAAYTALNTAINNLVDISALITEVSLETNYPEADYSVKSYKNYTDKLTNAKKITNNEINASQTEVDAALTNLQDAEDDLVKIADLKIAIDGIAAQANNTTAYTKSARNAAKEAVKAATEVYENQDLIGTEGKTAVEEACDKLDDINDELSKDENQRINTANLAIMRDFVEEIQERNADSEDSFSITTANEKSEKFAESYETALSYLKQNDEDESLSKADNEDVADATANLFNAYMHYIINQDSAEETLEVIVEALKEASEGNYTAASMNEVTEKVSNIAEYLKEASDLDLGVEDIKEELEELADELIEAVEELVEAVDVTNLELAIEKAEAFDTEGYTDESVAALAEAIEKGHEALDADLELSDENQATIDEATAAIEAAIKNLKLNTVSTPDTGSLTNIKEQSTKASNIIIATVVAFLTTCYAAYKLIFKHKNNK